MCCWTVAPRNAIRIHRFECDGMHCPALRMHGSSSQEGMEPGMIIKGHVVMLVWMAITVAWNQSKEVACWV